MKDDGLIQEAKTATTRIPVLISSTAAINQVLQLTSKFGPYKVIQLKVIGPGELTRFNYMGKILPVLALDDIAKVSLTFYKAIKKPTHIDVPASSLALDQFTGLPKPRYNTNCIIDFFQSKYKINTAITTTGWLIIQVTYEL